MAVISDRIDAVVQLQAGHLPGGVLGHVGRLAVLAAAQVDFGLRQLDAALRHEQAHDARVGPDRVVEQHPFPPWVTWLQRPQPDRLRLPRDLRDAGGAPPRR